MGMLEDERVGLTTDQAEKSRAMYMHSIDPENNPDPNAQEPIPVWGPEGPPTGVAVPATPAPVQSEEPYTESVQEEIVDEDDPFAQFDAPAPEEDEDPFAKYDDPSAEYAEEEDPFSAYPAAAVEPEPEPEPEPEEEGDIIDALVGGGKSMWNVVKTSWNAAFSDNEAVEDLAAESRGIKKTKAQEEFSETFAKRIKGKEDSLLDTIGGAIEAVAEKPRGALHESAAQAANMAPIWAGGVAGGKLGAMAGTAILPGVGTAVGAVVGAVAGMFTGNLVIEGGYAVQEEALKPGQISDVQIKEAGIGAAKKAAVITSVDVLTMGANRLMMGAPGRAAGKAVSTHLASKGIDAADNVATRAALQASPELMGEVMEVSAEALFQATGSILGKRGARGAVGMGLETVSEGVGDYFGTLASGKEATYGDAVIESLLAGPTSAAELAFVSTYKMGKVGKEKLLGLGPTVEAAADLESEIEADMDSLDATVDELMGPAEDLTGPLPQTPEAAEVEREIQGLEAESRVQEIENAQDSARERVLANGGDTLDAELEASKVAQDMGAADDDIKRHLGMVNRQTDKGIERRAESEKVAKENAKEAAAEAARVTKENVKSKIQEARTRIEEDKAYAAQKDKSGLGQTGDVGYIPAGPVTDEAVAGADGAGVVRGNQMAEAFAAAANEAATSPTNDLVEPSPAQIEAGNYKKGHVRKNGLDITIENPAGSTRRAADGSWKQTMKDHYGYIKGTESAEGKTEQLDVFVGEGEGIFVVDQINEDGTFDEHKVMMGYGNSVEARRAYSRNYPQGFKVGKITAMSEQEFKGWLRSGDQTQPVAKAGVPVAARAGQKEEVILSEPLDAKRDTRALPVGEQAEAALTDPRGKRGTIRYRLEDKAEDTTTLLSKIEKDGDGFTVDNATGKSKNTGFAAGVGLEKEFDGMPTADEVEAYREEHAATLAEKGNYLGSWMSGGNLFLDVSKVYPNNDMGRKRAYESAKARGEYGIQDLSKSAEEGYIAIDYKEGEREAIRAAAEGKPVRYRREEADGDKYFDEQAFKDVGPRFNSRTTLVYMSPDDFLQMAEKLRFPNEQKAREVKELADEGTAYNSLPFLSFDNEGTHGQTVQHEGRHRAMELKSRGVKSMPVRLTSGEQGSKPSFRWDDADLTLPKTLKGQSGNEIAFPKDAQATPEAAPEVEAHEGRAFKNFFSAVTKGLTGTSSTGAEYKPVIGSVRDAMVNATSKVSLYSTEYIKHRGKFDDHIAFSIPGYKEVQQAVGAALSEVYDSDSAMLDIGASEGSFAKAVTAISGMKSTSLDPNADMEESFNSVSTVPGADYSMTALGTADQEGEVAWTDEDTGTDVQYFDPMGKTYDVVHEAMVFQFVSNDRQEQISRVKELVSADGLFITEEKVFTTNQSANEAKKNKDHKALYFEQKDLDAKSAEVLEGMHKNMVHDFTLEEELAKNFKYVVQFWDSGNFKGYMASDSKATLDAAVAAMPDMSSDFSTTSTPRTVASAGKRLRITGEEVGVPMTSAKAKEVLGPLTDKMKLLQPIILANPSEAPADLKAQMEKDGALKAKGVFDPETNKLYIFSENHDSDADLVRTLLHEGVAHKGLRYLLADSHDAVMMDIYKNGDKAALGRIARRYNMDLSNTDDQIEAAEEYVAFVVESGVDSTVYQKVKAAVRRALRGLGLVKEWSEEDINALLRRSKRKMKGKPMAAANAKELRQIEKRKQVCAKLRVCIKS